MLGLWLAALRFMCAVGESGLSGDGAYAWWEIGEGGYIVVGEGRGGGPPPRKRGLEGELWLLVFMRIGEGRLTCSCGCAGRDGVEGACEGA